MKPVLQTKRLDIFRHRVKRNPKLGLPRDLYTAWHRLEDIPRPLCEVVVWPWKNGNWVEWVHVCQEFRRQGIATEVLDAIKKDLGSVSLSGATSEGEKLCEKMARKWRVKFNHGTITTRRKQ